MHKQGRSAIEKESYCGRAYLSGYYACVFRKKGGAAGRYTDSAFLTALLEGYAPEMCLHLAAAAGASCVAAYDALSGLKPFAELEQKIQKGWEKIC